MANPLPAGNLSERGPAAPSPVFSGWNVGPDEPKNRGATLEKELVGDHSDDSIPRQELDRRDSKIGVGGFGLEGDNRRNGELGAIGRAKKRHCRGRVKKRRRGNPIGVEDPQHGTAGAAYDVVLVRLGITVIRRLQLHG